MEEDAHGTEAGAEQLGWGPGAGGRFAPPEHLARGPQLLDPNNPLGVDSRIFILQMRGPPPGELRHPSAPPPEARQLVVQPGLKPRHGCVRRPDPCCWATRAPTNCGQA